MDPREDHPRVLVIDDDPDFRELVVMMAEFVGVEIAEAANCADGAKLVRSEHARIRLILLDYFMPGFEPTRCVEALRSATEGRVPIVLVTAAVDAAERAAELRLPRWLAKPFGIEELVSLLREVV